MDVPERMRPDHGRDTRSRIGLSVVTVALFSVLLIASSNSVLAAPGPPDVLVEELLTLSDSYAARGMTQQSPAKLDR